jgi:hypothetical protein
MIIRKHAARQHDIAKTSSWHVVSKVPKLSEQTMYLVKCESLNVLLPSLIIFHYVFERVSHMKFCKNKMKCLIK